MTPKEIQENGFSWVSSILKFFILIPNDNIV